MLKNINHLLGFAIIANHKKVGYLDNLLFDKQKWQVRHLVVNTGNLLPGPRRLIEPEKVTHIEYDVGRIHVTSTSDYIEQKPGPNTVSVAPPQTETTQVNSNVLFDQLGGNLLNNQKIDTISDSLIQMIRATDQFFNNDSMSTETSSLNLYSAREIIGYYIEATDGNAGYIEDVIVDCQNWWLECLTIDTHNWLPSRIVQLKLKHLLDIKPVEQKILIDVSKANVENWPDYDETYPTSFALA